MSQPATNYPGLYPEPIATTTETKATETKALDPAASLSFKRADIPPRETAPIQWKGRFVHVNPKGLAVRKTARAWGGICTGLGAASLATCLFCAVWLTAPEGVIVASTSVLFVSFLALTGLGSYLLVKREFWNDPAYLVEVGKRMEKGFSSLKTFYEQWGQTNRQYNILSRADLNNLLRTDAHSKKYKEFIRLHGEEAIAILDEPNRAAVRNALLEQLETDDVSSRICYETLKSVPKELLGKEGIQALLYTEARRAPDFETFLKRNEGGLEQLDGATREILNKLFDQLAKKKRLSHLQLTNEYKRIVDCLKFNTDAFMQDEMDVEFRQMCSRELSYFEFVKRFTLPRLQEHFYVGSFQHERLRTLFLRDVEAASMAVMDVLYAHADSCSWLKLSEDDLVAQMERYEWDQMTRGQYGDYAEFRKTRGLKMVQRLAQRSRLQQQENSPTGMIVDAPVQDEASPLRDLFLSMPFSSMTCDAYAQDRSPQILDITEALISDAILADLRSSKNYADFIAKHGLDVIQAKPFLYDRTLLCAKYLSYMVAAPQSSFNAHIDHAGPLGIPKEEVYWERFGTKEFLQVLSNQVESALFFSGIRNGCLDPRRWSSSALTLFQKGVTLKRIFDEWPELISWRVLKPEDRVGEVSLRQLFHMEMNKVRSFDDLMSRFGSLAFECDFIQRDDPDVRQLAIDELLQDVLGTINGTVKLSCADYLAFNEKNALLLARSKYKEAGDKRRNQKQMLSSRLEAGRASALKNAEEKIALSHEQKKSRALPYEATIKAYQDEERFVAQAADQMGKCESASFQAQKRLRELQMRLGAIDSEVQAQEGLVQADLASGREALLQEQLTALEKSSSAQMPTGLPGAWEKHRLSQERNLDKKKLLAEIAAFQERRHLLTTLKSEKQGLPAALAETESRVRQAVEAHQHAAKTCDAAMIRLSRLKESYQEAVRYVLQLNAEMRLDEAFENKAAQAKVAEAERIFRQESELTEGDYAASVKSAVVSFRLDLQTASKAARIF